MNYPTKKILIGMGVFAWFGYALSFFDLTLWMFLGIIIPTAIVAAWFVHRND